MRYMSSGKRPDRLGAKPSFYLISNTVLRPGISGRGVRLTTHLHPVPEVKNKWCYTSNPSICLYGVYRTTLPCTEYFMCSGHIWMYYTRLEADRKPENKPQSKCEPESEFDIVTKQLQNKMDVRSTNRWNLPQIILNIYLNFKMFPSFKNNV